MSLILSYIVQYLYRHPVDNERDELAKDIRRIFCLQLDEAVMLTIRPHSDTDTVQGQLRQGRRAI